MAFKLDEFESSHAVSGRFELRFPSDAAGLSQDEEWFSVRLNGGWTKMRLHDYDKIYNVPGLYEALVYDGLQCRSPQRLVALLRDTLDPQAKNAHSVDPASIRTLDLGAGNGVVARCLKSSGFGDVIGVDILPEAAAAARRDRPGVYQDYVVTDLTQPDPAALSRIRNVSPNCLIIVAALGFGDIPPDAFRTAFNEIESPGWMALTIKEDFLSAKYEHGFSGLIRRMADEEVMSIEVRDRIRHRLSIAGDPLFYTGLIARKLRDIPSDWPL
jgi:hypothetical protein